MQMNGKTILVLNEGRKVKVKEPSLTVWNWIVKVHRNENKNEGVYLWFTEYYFFGLFTRKACFNSKRILYFYPTK